MTSPSWHWEPTLRTRLRTGPGLYHVAFKAGDSIDDLRRAKAHFDALGVPVDAIEDHAVAQSIYLHDADGNAIEVYVDTSDLWRTDPRAVASISPLTL